MEISYQGGVLYEEGENNFQRISSTITSNIEKISQNVSSMSKMVNQLQTAQDSQELRNQLRQIQNYTQKLVKDTSTMIKDLMKQPCDHAGNKLNRERLSDEFMATLNNFQATQKLAAQKSKEDVKKVKAQSINIGDPFAASNANNNKELIEMDDAGLRKQEQLNIQTERTLIELEERERDIRQLENDIMDVNLIFKDLGTLIHTQGELVDSIEASVEQTVYNVESGHQELRDAANYKNKLRKKKVYLALILIIIILVILIIIFNH